MNLMSAPPSNPTLSTPSPGRCGVFFEPKAMPKSAKRCRKSAMTHNPSLQSRADAWSILARHLLNPMDLLLGTNSLAYLRCLLLAFSGAPGNQVMGQSLATRRARSEIGRFSVRNGRVLDRFWSGFVGGLLDTRKSHLPCVQCCRPGGSGDAHSLGSRILKSVSFRRVHRISFCKEHRL